MFVGEIFDSAHLKKKHDALQAFTFAGEKSVREALAARIKVSARTII